MRVFIYAPPDAFAGELATMADMLDMANRLAGTSPTYDVAIVADGPGPLRTASGLMIQPHMTVDEAMSQADLLIVAPGPARSAPAASVKRWLSRQAAGAGRYGAVGNGIFLFADMGLLDGRGVTAHWSATALLEDRAPAARIFADRIFHRDGPLFTGAGGQAVADLMLALIEEDHGRALALQMARHYVLFMQRTGGQAQLSVSLRTQGTMRDPIRRAQQHVRDHPAADLSVAALAGRVAMSTRNFSRVFVAETGMRPADYVETVRVNLARRMLEESALLPQQVAKLCGFSGAETARRAFRRRVGVTMAAYRASISDKG